MNSIRKILALICTTVGLMNCRTTSSGKIQPGTVAEVLALSQEQLKTPRPVHVRGTVTYGVASGTSFFVEDGTGGVRVNLLTANNESAKYGDEVEVSGVAVQAAGMPAIGRAQFRRLGEGVVLPASQATLRDLESGRFQNRRVVVAGTLMSTAISSDAGAYSSREFHVEVEGRGIVVRTADNKNWSDALVDAEVLATGVATTLFDTRGVPTRSILWANGLEAIRYTGKPTAPETLPVRRVEEFVAMDPARLPRHRVRLKGRLQGAGESLALEDNSGRISVRGHFELDDTSGSVDLVGFVTARDGQLKVEECALLGAADTAGKAGTPRAVMISARSIHQLLPRKASAKYPVRLRGVVTYHNLHDNLLFVEDSSDGIFVWSKHLDRQLSAGDLVEVTGVTSPGGFAPTVAQAHVRTVGHAGVPAPVRGMEEAAFLGHLDSRWIEMKGVVQSVKDNLLTVAWGTHTFKALVYLPARSLADLRGATVVIRGVSGSVVNKRRQLLGLLMHVPSDKFIEVVRRGPEDPFLLPLQSSADLLAFSPALDADRRARVRGVVTLAEPTCTLWLRDASGGIQVQPRALTSVSAGDEVEAAGLPAAGGYSVILGDAEIRKLKSGSRPWPIRVDPTTGFRPELDAQWVQIDATALNDASGPDGQVLLLQAGSVAFQARVAGVDKDARELPPPGTLLRLTGVYSVEQAENNDAVTRSFRLIVGSTADIQVLRGVSWWTTGRLLGVILVSVVVILAVAGWVLLLRREVRARVAQAEAAAERARAAEWSQSRQKQILDLIARHASLETILEHLAVAVSELAPGLKCTVEIARPGQDALIAGNGKQGAISRGPQPFLSFPIGVSRGARGFIHVIASDPKVLDRVAPEIAGTWLNLATMTIERHDLYDRLSFRATHDDLTELANRLAFSERLDAEIAISKVSGGSFALSYIDVDRFKAVNDTYGHEAGDLVLREISKRIRQCVRHTDLAARMGGDEFIVLMPAIQERGHAETIARDLLAALQRPISLNGIDLNIGASIGISVFPDDGSDSESLLRAADVNMYEDKNSRQRGSESTTSLQAIYQATDAMELVR